MKYLIKYCILIFVLILLALPGSSLSKPPVSQSSSFASLSPAEVSINPGELLPVKVQTGYTTDMKGATYYAEYRYSSELDISVYSTDPPASRAEVNTKRRCIFLEWENLNLSEGQSLDAYLYVSSLTTGTYSISPKKIYYKKNGKGKPFKLSGNDSIITVTNKPVIPSPPTELTALSVSADEITLTWDDNSSTEQGFYLERKIDTGDYIRIANVNENIITYKDAGLMHGTKYYYRISAYNYSGVSSYSNELIATTTAPVISVDPAAVNFGTVHIGEISTQHINIHNAGTGDLIMDNVSNPDDPFSIIKDECSGRSLSFSEDSCSIEIEFNALTEGNFSDEISIHSNDYDNPDTIVNISGSAEHPLDSLEIHVYPSSLDFGSVDIGDTSLSSLLIENSGNGDLAIDQISKVSSPFSIISDECSGQILSTNISCSLIVEFAPEKKDTYNSILTVESNDKDNPVTSVSLSGEGITPYTLETIRPTDAYNPGGWSDVASGYDGNNATYTYKDTPDSIPSISFGGSSADETVNAWESKSQHWNAAWLSVIFQRYPAADDTTELVITDRNGNLKHTILSAASSSISKSKYTERLDMSYWGDGFSSIGNLRVRVNGKRNKGSDHSQSMVYDIKITGDSAPFVHDFTRGSYENLPADNIGLFTDYSPDEMDKVRSDNNIRVQQSTVTNEHPVHLYKFKSENTQASIEWTGQIAQSPAESYAQSFVPTRSGMITKIDIFLEKEGLPDGNLYIRIKSEPGGKLIAESSSVSESSLIATGSWILFDFNETPYVSEGETYYMEVWRDNYSNTDAPVVRLMDCEKNSSSVMRRSLGSWEPETKDIIMADIYIDDVSDTSMQNCTYNGFSKDYLYGIDWKDIYLEAYNNATSSWDLIDNGYYNASENDVMLSGSIFSDDYFDSEGWVSARIYASSGTSRFNLATDSMEFTSLDDTVEFFIEPLSVNFGSLDINTSASETLTITSTGIGELHLGNISSMSPPFFLASDECSGHTLLPNDSCNLTIRFNPSGEGSFTGHVTIPTNDADSPNRIITAQGTAVSSALTGTVTDSVTGLPVTDVSVLLTDTSGKQYNTLTDANGTYSLTGLTRGDFTVKFTKADYYAEQATIDLPAGESSVLNVQIDPVIFKITSHSDGAITDMQIVEITGTAPAGSTVTVNNEPAAINGNIFSTTVTLDNGQNTITAEAVDSNGQIMHDSISIYYRSPITLRITEPENDQTFNTSSVTVNGLIYNTAGEGGGQEAIAQTFRAGRNGILTQISIPLFRTGSSATDNVFLRISSSVSGETIAVSNKIDFNNIPSPSYGWVSFLFDESSQVELVKGNTYYIELWRESKDNNNYLSWLFGSADYYPDGERFIRDNGSWDYPLEWGDFAFEVYFDGLIDQYQRNLGLSSYINLYGTNPYTVKVTVNGSDATVMNNSFQKSLDLVEGSNTITATASDTYGHTASDNLTVFLMTKGGISGVITDLSDGHPVEAAVVTLTDALNNIYTAQTSADGSYEINDILQGTFTLNISKEGYTSKTLSGTIIPGQTVIKDAALDPLLPVIKNISVSSITADSAVISWTTDMPCDSMVSYGPTSAYDSSESDPALVTNHKITLTDLSQGTAYHFIITSTNSYGFSSSSDDYTFTTRSPVSISIDYPADDEVIYRPDTMVRGTINNPANNETGVTVNGSAAVVYNGEFYVNHVSLEEGRNTVTATAVDTEGNTATDTIIVDAVPKDPHIVLRANIEYGASPLNTYFNVSTSIPYASANYNFDYEGDAISDYTGASFDDINVIYPEEGIYFPTLEITDEQGNTYTDSIAIIVLERSEIETLLQTKWNSMKNALITGDSESALDYFVDGNKNRYSRIFNNLGTSELIAILSGIERFELLTHTEHVAECGLIRSENSGSFAYPVIFVKDENGIWKIYGF